MKKNKKTRLPYCIICGKIDRSKLVTHYTSMNWPPYVICLECAGEVKEKKEDAENVKQRTQK